MKAPTVLAALALLATATGCAFMGDVMHAEGEYARKVGDAFHRQAARRDAAKARANKSQAAPPKTGAPPEN